MVVIGLAASGNEPSVNVEDTVSRSGIRLWFSEISTLIAYRLVSRMSGAERVFDRYVDS
jgi:hypothetical protein